MILLGKPITAKGSQKFCFIYKVVESDKLLWECLNLAEMLCEESPLTLSLAMEAVLRGRRGRDVCLKEGLALEADLGPLAYNTNDGKEALVAFVEKRKLNFTGI